MNLFIRIFALSFFVLLVTSEHLNLLSGKHEMASKLTTQLLQQNLENIITYINPYLPLANTAMINYIIDNLWVKNIPDSIQDEIKCTADAIEALNIFWSMKCISSTPVNSLKFDSYCQYLNHNYSNSLNALSDLWISPETLKANLLKNVKENSLNVKGFMSEKKAHEVCINISYIWIKFRFFHFKSFVGGYYIRYNCKYMRLL